MGNSYYDVECRDEELGIYAVRKRPTERNPAAGTVTYYLTLRDDGTWLHDCKAIQVYGNDYMCRHKRLVLQKYFINDQYKHLFNLTKKKKTP